MKKEEDTYTPQDVRFKVRILPAFKVIVEDDSTGAKWTGSSWYGDTAIDALRRVRASMESKQVVTGGKVRKEYGEIKMSSSTPELVKAVSWKEPIVDN